MTVHGKIWVRPSCGRYRTLWWLILLVARSKNWLWRERPLIWRKHFLKSGIRTEIQYLLCIMKEGGYGTVKGDQKFLTVSYDSVRIYVDNDEEDKGVKGGFAIGGYGITKGKTQKLLTVSDDSVRIYINDKSKGPKG